MSQNTLDYYNQQILYQKNKNAIEKQILNEKFRVKIESVEMDAKVKIDRYKSVLHEKIMMLDYSMNEKLSYYAECISSLNNKKQEKSCTN